MSDKSIKITEKQILSRFNEMCQESLSPDVYSMWADQIIPALNKIRNGLKPEENEKSTDKPIITVWKNGTYKIWRLSDAHYAANDPDWLVNIELENMPSGSQ